MNNVLCITAHPDDDTLFAGTLLKLKSKGWILHEAILTGGESGVSIKKDISDLKSHRATEAEQFAKAIGISGMYWLNGPDGFLSETKEIITELVKVIRKVKPQIVIVLNDFDYHKDHRASHNIAVQALELATRNAYTDLGKAVNVPLILVSDGLNVHSEPDIIVNTTIEHPKRMEILRTAYASQMDADLDRFSEGVALARGARIKTLYGEGFTLKKLASRPTLNEGQIESLAALLKN